MRPNMKKVLVAASVASMIDQFNLPNICLLLRMGFEVHVACNFKKGNTCDDTRVRKLQHLLRDLHVVWHQWDCPRTLSRIGQCVQAYRQVCRLLREGHFAWVHCHSPVGGALVRMAAHQENIPVVYTAHGFHFYQGAPLINWLLYYPAEKLLAHWTNILITLNREDYRLACRKLKAGRVCRLAGVGIDTGRFQGVSGSGFRKTYRIPENALLLLSVGELSRRKNHRIVLEALAALPGKDIYYMICGQGAWEAELLAYAEKLGVCSRIRLTGFLEEVQTAYRSADIFVFPSRQEGMPVALMEAMAAGLPCAVSKIRGSRELIDQAKGGEYFAPDDAAGLCLALNIMADSGIRKAYGAYNRRKIQMYDIRAVIPAMQKIYEEMAGFCVCR